MLETLIVVGMVCVTAFVTAAFVVGTVCNTVEDIYRMRYALIAQQWKQGADDEDTDD